MSLVAPLALVLAFASPGDAEEEMASAAVTSGASAAVVSNVPVVAFGLDVTGSPRRLWQRIRALPNLRTAGFLTAGGGLAGLSYATLDDDVREDSAFNGTRLGDLNDGLDLIGHPAIHMAGTGLLYGTSLFSRSPRLHAFSVDLFDTFLITDVASLGLKAAAGTTRPNGDPQGFPSGHTSSSFALASVVHRHFGWMPGLLGYVGAGAVGWHRIDTRNHDLSDVLFGTALGLVIGHSVVRGGDGDDSGPRIIPWADPESGAVGVGVEGRF